MFRSLHMKLVLIMLLLITSLMTIVGAFLMTSITGFYIEEFYQQMDSMPMLLNCRKVHLNNCQWYRKLWQAKDFFLPHKKVT